MNTLEPGIIMYRHHITAKGGILQLKTFEYHFLVPRDSLNLTISNGSCLESKLPSILNLDKIGLIYQFKAIGFYLHS